MKLKPVVIFIAIFLSVGLVRPTLALECGDQLPDSEAQLKTYIDNCQQKISELKGKQATLAAAIDYFTTQINLTRAKINSTQHQLDKLKLEIDDLSTKIDSLNFSLTDLSRLFAQRIRQAYIRLTTSPPLYYLFFSSDLKHFFSRYKYLEKIQRHDQQVLINLEKSRLDFDHQKQLKEIKQAQIQALQTKLNRQQQILAQQKTAKNKLLQDTKNSEARYRQLLSRAQSQLAAFSRYVSLQGGASLLTNQTKCDSWGCYYNQRDSQWGQLAIGLSSSPMAKYGCLVTSMAMVASYYGKQLTPKDIALSSNPFWANTAYMLQGSWTVNSITMSRTRVGYGLKALDQELALGKPVIVGLYKGPDHFIVVKQKDGDNYLINDPFIKNGADIKLKSHYPLSAVNTVDRVRVN